MKDQVLEKALARRAQFQKKLDELDRFIRTYNVFKGDEKGSRSKGWGDRRSATKDILDKVAEILSKDGPLTPVHIVSRLYDQGVRLGGNNPPNTLSAMLSGSKERFKSLGRREGWTVLK